MNKTETLDEIKKLDKLIDRVSDQFLAYCEHTKNVKKHNLSYNERGKIVAEEDRLLNRYRALMGQKKHLEGTLQA